MQKKCSINKNIISKIFQLERAIWDVSLKGTDVNLMEGITGVAFIYSNLYEKYPNEEYINKIQIVLNSILKSISTNINSVSLCNGFSGNVFALNIINQLGFFEMEIEDILKDCDKTLISAIENNINNDSLDYLHGSLGIAYYFYDREKQKKLENGKYKFIFENILVQIDTYIANVDAYDLNSKKDFFLNLGFAHGILSLIVFLSKNIKQDEIRITKQLKNLIRILLRYETPYSSSISKFPSIVNFKNSTVSAQQYSIPLGWCYGDTITAYSIYVAGEALQDQRLIKKAMDVGLSSCERLSGTTSKVVDACFCHGSSGVAYLYKRLYELSGNYSFKKSYNFWIKKTIELCNFKDGIAGYKKFSGEEYVNNIGILDGAAGPAIVLLDYVNPINTSSWEKIFMIN
jgi:lantibiotic biosynthesis protein